MNNTNVHSKFTLISLFSKIHSLKSEHIHSFLFREYVDFYLLNDKYVFHFTKRYQNMKCFIKEFKINVLFFYYSIQVYKYRSKLILELAWPGNPLDYRIQFLHDFSLICVLIL